MDWTLEEHPFNAPEGFQLSSSLWKSMLQKNVRLSRPEAAVRCAVQMCAQGTFIDFLRRLSIIILEVYLCTRAPPL
jgi:hypothetical protein